MAFSTIPGTGANSDVTEYIGTQATDALALVNQIEGIADVRGQASADAITWTSYTNVTSKTSIRGGQGLDTFNPTVAASGTLNGVFINGQKDRDVFGGVIGLSSAANTTLMGGQGNDAITFAGAGTVATGSLVNGNKDADVITTVGLAASSVFGGQGIDQLIVSGANTGSKIAGNLDNDTLTLAGTFTGTTVNGNGGNDNITDAGAITAFGTSTVFGGSGNDTINLGGNATTIGLILSGDAGNDALTANNGTDTLTSGAGADTLTGGAGADNLTGGTGADSFTQTNLSTAAQTATTDANGNIAEGETITIAADIIVAFEAGTDTMNTTGGIAAQVRNVGQAVDNATNNGEILVRGNFANGVFTIAAAGADGAYFDATNAAGAALATGTAFTVFSGQGANLAAIAAGNWA